MRVSLIDCFPFPACRPSLAHRRETLDRIAQQRPRDPPHPVLVGFERDVFDRRLAVDPRQQQPRQQARGARFEHLRRLPGDAAEIGFGEKVEAGEKTRDRLPVPQAFEQQVVEAEREVEGRVAVPGAFGVEKHRPARTDQDVFRADIAMDQREAGARR